VSAGVLAAFRVLDAVAGRRDPTRPTGVGEITGAVGTELSAVSRRCTELERLGFLRRGPGYGEYLIGPAAVRLSGRSAAPFARAVRFVLTRVAMTTGETAVLAAPGPQVRIVASVGSAWTLHAPAPIGEVVHESTSAIARTAAGEGLQESTVGLCVEISAPVLAGAEIVAVVAVRLPVNRRRRGIARARKAVQAARRALQEALNDQHADQHADRLPVTSAAGVPAVEAGVRVLEHLAGGPDDVTGIAAGTGLRSDRTARLLESCVDSGLVTRSDGRFAVAGSVHAWYRAATSPTLVTRGGPLVAATADATGACAFLTVLHGMRSLTVVEELENVGPGLVMMPWLGRPHPIVGSSGGPTLVSDFSAEQVTELLGPRSLQNDLQNERDTLTNQMRRVVRDGVLSMESHEEGGVISVSAPVRDAAGCVAGAACLVGPSDWARPRIAGLRRAARGLADDVSALLT